MWFLNQPGRVGSKPSRAKAEMRNIATALETYYIDNNEYPPAIDEKGNIIPYGEDGVSEGYTSSCLTTPIAHLPSLPTDPFHDAGDGYYRYATNGASCWIMSSNGPDRDTDLGLSDYFSKDVACSDVYSVTFSRHFSDEIYDPTNGTTSNGDIFRSGP